MKCFLCVLKGTTFVEFEGLAAKSDMVLANSENVNFNNEILQLRQSELT